MSQYEMLKTRRESENREYHKSLLKLQCTRCEKTFQYQEELTLLATGAGPKCPIDIFFIKKHTYVRVRMIILPDF